MTKTPTPASHAVNTAPVSADLRGMDDVGAQPAPAQQPDALLLAQALDDNADLDAALDGNPQVCQLERDAAAELRRQDAESQQLRGSLEAQRMITERAIALGKESDAKLTVARAEAKHWRSNHDNVVARLRTFTQRPDIPKELADRLPWYRELVRLQAVEAQAAAKCLHQGAEAAAVAALKGLLSLVRREAPQLSGKVLGDAESAIAALQAAPPVQALSSECDSPELCRVHGGCAGQYGTKRTCPSFAVLNPCNPAASAQTVPGGMWTIWESLPGYLIDHCEGEIISEEGLQRALEAMLKNPQYSMPPAPLPAAVAVLDEREMFEAWVRTHEDAHGAFDDWSAWAGWQARAALAAAPAQPFAPSFADGLLHSTVLHKLWEESEPIAQRGLPGALAWQLGVFAGKVAQAAAPAPAQAYSIDADPQGIRAYVADAITGALACGAQGSGTPPPDHWLTPFWRQARFGQIQYNALRDATDALLNAPGAAQEHATQLAGQGQECAVCFSDEAFTGACGGGRKNPRALCFEGAAPIQAQEDARDLEAEALRACRDLPEGWDIVIHLEKGSGSVVLIDPEFNENDLAVDGSLFDTLKKTIDQALHADAARAVQGGAA